MDAYPDLSRVQPRRTGPFHITVTQVELTNYSLRDIGDLEIRESTKTKTYRIMFQLPNMENRVS